MTKKGGINQTVALGHIGHQLQFDPKLPSTDVTVLRNSVIVSKTPTAANNIHINLGKFIRSNEEI